MKRIRYWLIQLLGVSKFEANGAIMLFIVMILLVLIPELIKITSDNYYSMQMQDQKTLDSLVASIELKTASNNIPIKPNRKKNTFNLKPFNPNKSTFQELISLGLNNKQGEQIVNYRSKGGTFRTKSDLLKIYSIDSQLYTKLQPYILLPNQIDGKSITKTNSQIKNPIINEKKLSPFDINIADTVQLKKIYGIGSVLSKRIIKYRKNLGGFISKNQLEEVYGLNTDALDKLDAVSFISEEYVPNQISINTADVETLSKHSYINYKIAKTIIDYRRQHGKYTSIEELKKNHLITDELLEKISPYLVID